MISPRLRAAATLIAVFALGAATGAAGMRYVTYRSVHRFLDAPPWEARRRAMMWAIERNLTLTGDQRTRIEAILAGHGPELAAIARHSEPEVEALTDRIHAEIRATLTPDQLAPFDELAARIKERHRRALAGGGEDGGAHP